MSFFGGGGNAITRKILTIDSSNLVNSVLFTFISLIQVSYGATSSATFNGTVKIQYLKNDNTWADIGNLFTGADVDTTNFVSSPHASNGIYPPQYRIVIQTHATLGTAELTLDYL